MNQNTEQQFSGRRWITQGLLWGAIMFVIIELLLPFAQKEEINQSGLLKGAVIWTIGGLVYGLVMKAVMNRRQK